MRNVLGKSNLVFSRADEVPVIGMKNIYCNAKLIVMLKKDYLHLTPTIEHTTVIDCKTVTHQYPITYVSGLFQGSQLNWAPLTKEAYEIYLAFKKFSFHLADASITLQREHLH